MAGIFALLYGLIVGAGKIIDSTQNNIYLTLSKKNAIVGNKLTYWDKKGNEFYVGTDTLCKRKQDIKTGHWILIELDNRRIPTGRILYDFDKENEINNNNQERNIIEEAKERGWRYVRISNISTENNWGLYGYDIERGQKYAVNIINQKNKKLYKCRYIDDNYYFYTEPINHTKIKKYKFLEGSRNEFYISFEQYSIMTRQITNDKNWQPNI